MAKDRYRYFRIEAEELLQGLARGFLDLDKGGANPDLVRKLLRLAHTLKGAARVVKLTELGARAHEMEELLSAHRDSAAAVPRPVVEHLQSELDRIRELVAAIDRPAQDRAEAPAPADDPLPVESVRIDVADLDELLDSVSELGSETAALKDELEVVVALQAQAADLARAAGDLEGGRTTARARETVATLAESLRDGLAAARRSLFARAGNVERELADVRQEVARMRLLPAHTLFPDLERIARDTAASLNRRVEFATAGGDVRLDAHVLSVLKGALIHVVRNAVAHGIEDDKERRGAGKSATGTITLAVDRVGYGAKFVCQDDGRGIDENAVRRALIRNGKMTEAEAAALSPQELAGELLRGGVTTRPSATEISGRGVGLDAVRASVQQLKGEVRLSSRANKGATVEISVPVSLSALPALRVEGGDAPALIPLDAVRTAFRLRDHDLARGQDGETLCLDGRVIPFLPLREAIGRNESAKNDRDRTAVVIEAQGRRAAIGVDRVGGVDSVIVRRLPSTAKVDPVVAGAALDRRGVPELVLAPDALVTAARTRRVPAPASGVAERPVVLVIDDSLTTRMLEQSILESAGYEVDVAVSGEEALQKARHRPYGLFVVDVEMPGMDGFEFVASTRADPRLRDIPAIIVTSRADAADRRRGKEVGARAYIVKGEFDQGALLAAVRGLIG